MTDKEIIPYDPATLLEIRVGDVSAPVKVGVEMSKAYLTVDQIIRELVKDIKRDEETGKLIMPPDLLPWTKEARMLLKEIYSMTGELEKMKELESHKQKAKSAAELIKALPMEERIKIFKGIKNAD